jgi:polysaccharide biosynthesis/export protein
MLPAQQPAEQATAQAPRSYVLQAGDIVDVRVYNFPELSQETVILPDGRLSVPLMNDVEAAGKTPSQLADFLTAGLGAQVRNPKVSVIVKGFAGRNVYVGGEVAKPTQLQLIGPVTAVQAIFQAGGASQTADTANVVLLRNKVDGPPETLTFNMESIIRNQRPDIALSAGDVIYVPKSTINVYVGGEVERPGIQPLNKRLTLMAALVSAGGTKRSAKMDEVLLLRDNGSSTPLVSKLDVKQILKGAADPTLQPYDVVIVPKSGIAKVNDWVDQYLRQMSPITLSLGFSYVLGFPVQSVF